MGNSASTSPSPESDDDTYFYTTSGAVPSSKEMPWGKDGITLEDVARHAAIADSVIRRAGGPSVASTESQLEPQYRFEATLLARLRSELGFGSGVSDADISAHVRRVLEVAAYCGRIMCGLRLWCTICATLSGASSVFMRRPSPPSP